MEGWALPTLPATVNEHTWGPGGVLHSTDPTTIYVPGIGHRSNGLYLYFHPDWLGSTRYTSRSGGVATEQMRYDGWGQRMWLNHLDPANPANPLNPFHPTDFQWGGAWGLQTETADSAQGCPLAQKAPDTLISSQTRGIYTIRE